MKLLREIYKTNSKRFRIRNLLISLIIITSGIILSNPNKINEEETILKNGIDIMLALDVSESMLAQDFEPDRLTVAKEVLTKFSEKIETDRLWLVIFAGKPFTSIPLTFDYTIVKEILNQIDTSSINQRVRGLNGTAIGDAMITSLNLLEKAAETEENQKKKEKSDREKIIVLLTDGEANQWLDPKIVAKLAKEKNIKIYTVGIGSTKGWYLAWPFGKQEVPPLDEASLKHIADTTNAQYRRADNKQTFEEIFDTISDLTKNDIETESKVTYKKAYRPFSILLFILLLWLWIQEQWRKIEQ